MKPCPECGVVEGYMHLAGCKSKCPGCSASIGEMHSELCPVRLGTYVEPKVNEVPKMLSREKAAELLKHVEELINGDRAKDYGDPHQSFQKIADLWSTYLHHEITVTDVGMMMILLKVARNGRGRNKSDNFVDICGYASLTGSQVFEKDK